MGTCHELVHTFLVHQLCGKFLYALKFGGKSHCSRELLEKARLPLQSVSSRFPFLKFAPGTLFFSLPAHISTSLCGLHRCAFFFLVPGNWDDARVHCRIFSFALAIRIPFVNVS